MQVIAFTVITFGCRHSVTPSPPLSLIVTRSMETPGPRVELQANRDLKIVSFRLEALRLPDGLVVNSFADKAELKRDAAFQKPRASWYRRSYVEQTGYVYPEVASCFRASVTATDSNGSKHHFTDLDFEPNSDLILPCPSASLLQRLQSRPQLAALTSIVLQSGTLYFYGFSILGDQPLSLSFEICRDSIALDNCLRFRQKAYYYGRSFSAYFSLPKLDPARYCVRRIRHETWFAYTFLIYFNRYFEAPSEVCFDVKEDNFIR